MKVIGFDRLSLHLSIDPEGKLKRYFVAISIIVSGWLIQRLAIRLDMEMRLGVICSALFFLLTFFGANNRHWAIKVGLGTLCLLFASFSMDGAVVALLWLALQLSLAPSDSVFTKRIVSISMAILAVYVITTRLGLLISWDDRVGRYWVAALNGLFQLKAEKPTIQALFGPWLLLLAGVAAANIIPIFSSKLRIRLVVLSVLLFAIPIFFSLLMLNAIPLMIGVAFFSMGERQITEFAKGGSFRIPLTATLVVLVALGFYIPQYDRSSLPKRVAIADVGLGTLKPERGLPVETHVKYEANFGRFARFLRHQGIEVSILPENWGEATLAGFDTIVLINQTKYPTPEQVQALYRTVAQGKKLVIAADHTDIMGVMGPTNAYLAPVPMRLNFDSAMPFPANREWHKALWLSPLLQGALDAGPSSGISVGASLNIWGGSLPLVVGHLGFSDPGDKGNPPGHLANLIYNTGEPLYDIPLIAEASYGQGTVVCYGDTSSFQDSAITESGPLLLSTLSLHNKATGSKPIVQILFVLTCLFAITFELLAFQQPLFSICIIATILFTQNIFYSSEAHDVKLSGAIVIDKRTTPEYPNYYPEEKLDKLAYLCDRQGIELFFGDGETAAHEGAKAIIIEAPTIEPSNSFVKTMSEYVQNGGNLLIVCGEQHYESCQKLLRAFGMAIQPTPLGGIDTTELVDLSLRDQVFGLSNTINMAGQPGLLADSYEVSGADETVTRTLDKPTVVRKRVGNGLIIVVGDSRFLTSKSLGKDLGLNLIPSRLLYALLEELNK